MKRNHYFVALIIHTVSYTVSVALNSELKTYLMMFYFLLVFPTEFCLFIYSFKIYSSSPAVLLVREFITWSLLCLCLGLSLAFCIVTAAIYCSFCCNFNVDSNGLKVLNICII